MQTSNGFLLFETIPSNPFDLQIALEPERFAAQIEAKQLQTVL